MSKHLQVIEAARIGGLEALREMALDGTLTTQEFARRRGWTSLGLHRARGDGRVFSVAVRGRCHFAAVLAALPEAFMVELVAALGGLGEASKLLFLLRRHGSLAGDTVLAAHARGAGDRVLELARGWAEEGGHP